MLVSQNIKTIQFKPLQSKSFSPITRLGSVLELSFDDLDADNKEYQYKIEHMTHDWKPSNLIPSQYINGYESDYINDVTNSFNTLQNYTHYRVTFPNSNTRITKSGNYLVSVIDEDYNVVFSRRCVFYEETAMVGVSVQRGRDLKSINQTQTVQFVIDQSNITINNPQQELNVVLFQNNNWNTAIYGLQPQFFETNRLVYNYVQGTNFWGGNEFLNFDTKNIRNSSLTSSQVIRKNIYHHYLYTDLPRVKRTYTYNPDINGAFQIRTLESDTPDSEADYAMMHFSLKADLANLSDKDLYIYGAFNNFELTEENKMRYKAEAKLYEASILLKQGFYNYNYLTKSKVGKINYTEIDGSFFETENEYTVIVYYKPFGEIYDRVIGVGNGFFNQNR